LIAERRVQTAAIIVSVDERFDVAARVLEIDIIVSIDLFALDRLHKTLTTRIVVWIHRPAHGISVLSYSMKQVTEVNRKIENAAAAPGRKEFLTVRNDL